MCWKEREREREREREKEREKYSAPDMLERERHFVIV
jgi:hypothetical protein